MKKKDIKNVIKALGSVAWQLDANEVKRLYAMLIAHGIYPVCPLCKEPISSINDFTWDHIIPRSRGGKDHISNMAPAHAKCNEERGKTFVDELFDVEYKFKIDMPVADESAMSLKEIKRKKKYARCKSRIKEYQHANNASKKR